MAYREYWAAASGLQGILCWVLLKDGFIVLGFEATLTAKVVSWLLVTHMFPGFLSPVLTQLSFQSHRLFFLECFRGERRKYPGKKIHFNRVSNSKPPGHKSDTLTTELLLKELWENISICTGHHNIAEIMLKTALLTLSQISPAVYVSALQIFWKHCGKRTNCLLQAISPFPTVFSTILENFLLFSSNLKL